MDKKFTYNSFGLAKSPDEKQKQQMKILAEKTRKVAREVYGVGEPKVAQKSLNFTSAQSQMSSGQSLTKVVAISQNFQYGPGKSFERKI